MARVFSLAEIQELAAFPREVLATAQAPATTNAVVVSPELLASAEKAEWPAFLTAFDGWRNTVEPVVERGLALRIGPRDGGRRGAGLGGDWRRVAHG